ncbi:MAG: DUF4097 domain-containing protein [Lachnospiraceae bacterium]|nr:DUF4097 domain-containing protein [Lachnospiraceae bacterium]
MDRKKYLGILTAVTIICILAGLYIHIFRHTIPMVFGFGKGGTEISETVECGEFSRINMELDAFNTEIVRGDGYRVSYSCSELIKPEVKVNGNELSISQKMQKNVFYGVNPGISGKGNQMTITVPEGVSIDYITADTDFGNVNINGVDMTEADLDTDAGNIFLSGTNAKAVDVNTDAGNVTISQSGADSLRLKTDAGNIIIDDSDVKRVELSSDIGNIDISGSFDEISGESSVGNINYDPDNAGQESWVILNTDVGTVRVSGQSYGNKYTK